MSAATGPYTVGQALPHHPQSYRNVIDATGDIIGRVYDTRKAPLDDTATLLAASWDLREALQALIDELTELGSQGASVSTYRLAFDALAKANGQTETPA